LPCGGDQARPGSPGVGLASQQKGYPSIHFMQCIHFKQHEEDKAVAQDHAIVLDLPPAWSKFNASNWFLNILWPGV